jgi:hypothetical protein
MQMSGPSEHAAEAARGLLSARFPSFVERAPPVRGVVPAPLLIMARLVWRSMPLRIRLLLMTDYGYNQSITKGHFRAVLEVAWRTKRPRSRGSGSRRSTRRRGPKSTSSWLNPGSHRCSQRTAGATSKSRPGGSSPSSPPAAGRHDRGCTRRPRPNHPGHGRDNPVGNTCSG